MNPYTVASKVLRFSGPPTDRHGTSDSMEASHGQLVRTLGPAVEALASLRGLLIWIQ